DEARNIAVDAAGNAYITGSAGSGNFPTINPLFSYGGGLTDAFVAKLNAAGSALVYSTYLGGSGEDHGYGIALDAAGTADVSGHAVSANFPTMTPIKPAHAPDGGRTDGFVAKLNASGTALTYSTYLGGNADESMNGIAVDSAGSAYVTGQVFSTDFPTM